MIGRVGTTLVELLIVLVILGLATSVVGIAPGWIAEAGDGRREESLARARLQAINQRREVTVMVATSADSIARPVVFFPDGRALGAPVDPLTGRRR